MGQRLALIVGNSLYADTTLARLKTPDVDVGAFGEILLDSEQGGFDDVNVLVNMSSHVIRRTIASFFAKRTREDLLLLYFSGHGVLDDQGLLYLAVRDTDSKLLRGTAVSANFITEEMNNSRSQRQVLILDCCHSGAFARGTKGKPGSSVGTATAFEGSGYGRVVLTASDATQYAWEGDQVIGDAENSLFTHYILEGIKSGAADTNGDGQITIDELYDYVYEHVIRQTPRQTPGKWSYKEQGEIVIARVLQAAGDSSSVDKLRDFDPNLDERLDKLYNEGLSAYWLEEWDKAIRCFQTILEVRPDYPDAANKFELSKRQLRLLTLYNQVLEAEQDGDWLLAISRLDELLSLSPDFRDARQKLESAKRNRLLSDLYAEAQQLTNAGKFRAVLNVFTQISNLQPDYPDPENLLPTAEKEVVEQQRQTEIEQIYTKALRELDSGNWGAAEELLRDLQSNVPDYPGVERLLERAQTERSKDEAARQRNEQITMLSQQAVGLARAKQWHQVLVKIEEIQALDPNYEDSDQLAVKAREEIERQTQETRREEQLAAMYAAAVKSLDAGEYQKALQQWAEVLVLDPKYPDRKKVQKTAKKKLKEIAEPKESRRKLSKSVIAMIGLVGVIIIIVFVAWLAQNLNDGNFSGLALIASKTPTKTPRPSATPTRRPTSTAATPLAFSDNFNNSAYDGKINHNVWWIRESNPGVGNIEQHNGAIFFSLNRIYNDYGLHLIQAEAYPFDIPIYTEAKLRVDKSSSLAHLGINMPFPQIQAVCQIQATGDDDTNDDDQICCFTYVDDLSKYNESLSCHPIIQGTWHKIKIEVSELNPFTFEFYIDNQNIGQIIPAQDLHITNQVVNLQINLSTFSHKPGLGFLDDFSFGPLK